MPITSLEPNPCVRWVGDSINRVSKNRNLFGQRFRFVVGAMTDLGGGGSGPRVAGMYWRIGWLTPLRGQSRKE